jgi:hypothetical protein
MVSFTTRKEKGGETANVDSHSSVTKKQQETTFFGLSTNIDAANRPILPVAGGQQLRFSQPSVKRTSRIRLDC